MTTVDEFERWLRHALRHLYDPSILQASPLISVFGLSDEAAPASALRRMITEMVRSMQPGADVPDNSSLWSMYEILLLRYVQQCSQLEVADQLGLSSRHLRRKERQAIEYLGRRLRDKIAFQPDQPVEPTATGPAADDACPLSVEQELTWLRESAASGSGNLTQALASALQLVRPMADARQATLSLDPQLDLPPIAIHPVGLHQILVRLLSTAIRWTTCGRVELGASLAGPDVVVTLGCCSASPQLAQDAEFRQNLAMTRRLVEACGGSMDFEAEGAHLTAEITLPTVSQLDLLVIDDNQDVLDLLRRYTSGTRYRTHGVRDLDQALALAAHVHPRAIILDVMMPGIGGWEALGRLRNHPLTQSTPVIICTILPERELALSLGANGFIHKPFSRAEFLGALDDETGLAGLERG